MAKRKGWMPTQGFFMEVEGDRRAVLCGCRGICTYTEEQVALRTPFGVVVLYGQGLEMGCMTAEGATVTGRIRRIEFGEDLL
ncbi:MAG: YabP/YqfC family sporulation protein [Clostridia bacterium]|nr:YabP/YqfC family sporulation protein [Clostridia bacterium]